MAHDEIPSDGPNRRRRKGYYPTPATPARKAPRRVAPEDSSEPVIESAPVAPDPLPLAEPAVPHDPASPPEVAEDGESIAADRVELTRAAVGRVDTRELSVSQGAVGAARAESIHIDRGALGAALAGEVEVERGVARTVLAREVELEQAFARTVIAGEVRAEGSFIAFLLARNVSGNVRVLFDWRGALAFGAAAGLLAGLIGRIRKGASDR